MNVTVNGTDDGDGMIVNLGTTNTNSSFHVKDSGGNTAFKVDGSKAVSIGGTLDVVGNVTLDGNLDINGTTTTIDTVNLSVQDSIIALGVSGSGEYSNVGDRGILFPRGTAGSVTAGLWWDDTQFNLGKTLTGPTSSSFVEPTSANWAQLKVGNLLPGEDDTYDLGSTSLAWKDLHLEGDVLMTDTGKVETTAGDLTISSAAAQVVIDAETDIEFNANGNNFFFKDNTAGILEVTSLAPGDGSLIGVLSASQGNLALCGEGSDIHLAKGPFAGSSVTLDVSHETARVVKFKLGTIEEARTRLELDDRANATCVSELSGSLLLDDGATAAEIRFKEAGTGTNFVGIQAADSITSDITFTLPNAFPGASGQAVVSSDAGVLSFSEIPGATTKGVKIIGATVNAGSDVNFNTVDVGDTISGMVTNTDDSSVDVFVNGQLLVSGSAAERGAGTRDYDIKSSTVLNFAFNLEVDDVVQVVKRG